ncbi:MULTISPECIES: MerR family transcriptional regulator [Pacificibacter]|uniref:MerR family transcriptional regulator n=1 Tax=Pacificibacter TaxID=1042323 RepID=UPI001C08B356|nr:MULTISPECIES: MerR family DNA-binding transcriptional regulator [Pacificibacter]MBU2935904.1 MerR family DNA-binding transcriptional regulator [Pacificibacter marinus]MDO6614399.1 MerR family DNA-binding transcriptional regulator [Pacificibacter sp. 1_MG-2023]
MPNERLTFKEMCSRFDVTPRTLRYYEYIELLSPEKEGRTRFYTSRELARMKLILRGRKYGFSLEEIRQWLLIYNEEGTAAQSDAFIALADRQLTELQRQHSEIETAISELGQLRQNMIDKR